MFIPKRSYKIKAFYLSFIRARALESGLAQVFWNIMARFNSWLIICAHLISIAIIMVQSQKGKWNMDTSPDCELSDDQWNLIAWYFERVSYLEVTQIVTSDHYHRRASRFCDYAIKKLAELTNIEYQTFIVDYNFKDDDIPPQSNTYTWHEERFEPRHTIMTGNVSRQPYRTPWIQDTIETAKERFKTAYRVREDEPDFGSVVIAESVEVFDHYLNGDARHPFYGKRAHYALIVHKPINDTTWHDYASSVMAKMWKVHGILNAIILSSCNKENVSSIGSMPTAQPNNFFET